MDGSLNMYQKSMEGCEVRKVEIMGGGVGRYEGEDAGGQWRK